MRCEAQMTWFGQCFEVRNLNRVRGGCRHEHVKERMLCGWHTEDLLNPESHATCMECWQAGHDCSVVAKVVG